MEKDTLGAVLMTSVIWLFALLMLWFILITKHNDQLVELGVAHWELIGNSGDTKFVIDAAKKEAKD